MLVGGTGHEGDAIPVGYEGVPPREIRAEISVEVEVNGPDSRFIMLRRNERPGLTTLQACWRRPIRDSSSLLRHAFLSFQSSKVALMRVILSAGRRRDQATVSSSMPRKVRHDVGPSHFPAAMGTPSSLQARFIVCRLSAH